MVKFTQFCNFGRPQGKISVFKNSSPEAGYFRNIFGIFFFFFLEERGGGGGGVQMFLSRIFVANFLIKIFLI